MPSPMSGAIIAGSPTPAASARRSSSTPAPIVPHPELGIASSSPARSHQASAQMLASPSGARGSVPNSARRKQPPVPKQGPVGCASSVVNQSRQRDQPSAIARSSVGSLPIEPLFKLVVVRNTIEQPRNSDTSEKVDQEQQEDNDPRTRSPLVVAHGSPTKNWSRLLIHRSFAIVPKRMARRRVRYVS